MIGLTQFDEMADESCAFTQARMVAAATSNLCEAANASVQGHASEEKLISSAKQVAASTAQLLVACKVKADQDSEAMRRLQVRISDPFFPDASCQPCSLFGCTAATTDYFDDGILPCNIFWYLLVVLHDGLIGFPTRLLAMQSRRHPTTWFEPLRRRRLIKLMKTTWWSRPSSWEGLHR